MYDRVGALDREVRPDLRAQLLALHVRGVARDHQRQQADERRDHRRQRVPVPAALASRPGLAPGEQLERLDQPLIPLLEAGDSLFDIVGNGLGHRGSLHTGEPGGA